MVKLPDVYSTATVAQPINPKRPMTNTQAEVTAGSRAWSDALGKVEDVTDKVRVDIAQTKAMELENKLDDELFQFSKKAKTATDPDAIEQEFEERSKELKKEYLQWVPDRRLSRRMEGRFEQKIGRERESLFNQTAKLRKDQRFAAYEEGVRGSFKNIGDMEFPEERIPEVIIQQNQNLDALCQNGDLTAVECGRIKDKYVKDAVKTWNERKTVSDPGAQATFLNNYLKARKSGALNAYSKFQPADKGARAKMATMMFDSEARKDGKGRVQIYELPAGDGGGSYEVAGINDRFHPEMAAKLAGLVRRGNHAEAERQAKAYYQKITDKAGQVVADKGAGVEYVMRDIALNRGHGGALATLRLALGYDDVSPRNQRAAYAPLNADEKKRLAEMSPEALVRQLTMAREEYEDRFAGARPQFREGLQNRWAKVGREAMSLGATPTEDGPQDNTIPLPPEMAVGHELLKNLSDVEVKELADAAERELKTQSTAAGITARKMRKSDLMSIEATGKPVEGTPLTPEHQEARARATLYYDATKDIASLSEADMETRLATFRQIEKDAAGKPEFADAVALRKKIEKAYEGMENLRKADPVVAAEDHVIMRGFNETVYKGAEDPEQWEDRIRARLTAQAELGIDFNDQRVLSEKEAFDLVPDLRNVPPREIYETIYTAAIKAQDTYGAEFAKRAMLDALRFRKYVSKDEAAEIVNRALTDTMGRDDARYVKKELEAARMFGEDSFMSEDELEASNFATGQSLPSDDLGMLPGGKTAQAIYPMPTQKAFEFAKSKGEAGAKAFDEMFGPGAFKRAETHLQKAQ